MENKLDTFKPLADKIKSESSGKRIIYIPNAGNYGDGLIRYATKAFFFDYGIKHIEISTQALAKLLIPILRVTHSPAYFIYGGGGAWHSGYRFGYETASYISKITRNLMVLPSTYGFPVRLENAIMYRRDNSSSYRNAPDSIFCHDMALYLAVQSSRKYKRSLFEKEICYSFRTDAESNINRIEIPEGNIDFSTLGDHMSNSDDFIRIIGSYKKIITDRLHVAVAASLCGSDVVLHEGNYPKIRDIYNDSLRDFFPRLTLERNALK